MVQPDHYHQFETVDWEMFNLVIAKELWDEIVQFLRESSVTTTLTSAKSPLQLMLPRNEVEHMQSLFEAFC